MELDKAQVKEKIEEEIVEVKKGIEELTLQSRPISPENAIGRVSRMDAINNKSISEASLRQSQDKLAKLEKALNRIDEPDFGICVGCKKPIPLGRLMLMPHASRCVNCA